MSAVDSRASWQKIGLFVGPLVALGLCIFFRPVPEQPAIGYMAGVIALMAIWWITEAIPLAATSLIPFLLFPLFGILDAGKVASSYMTPTVFLFLGGFMIALAMERWNLHRRVALAIIAAVGSKPSSIVLGFMLASGFISMWISNTATTIMMLPIGMALVIKMEEAFGKTKTHSLAVCIMLAIAYGASIGGTATLVGTPTNMVLVAVYAKTFPNLEAVTFGKWFMLCLPFSILMLFGTWFLLTRFVFKLAPDLVLDAGTIHKERQELGPMTYAEKTVAAIFVAAAFLWIFRVDMNLGSIVIPGWQRLWKPLETLGDGSVGIGLALLLFLLPSQPRYGSEPILNGSIFNKVPWDIIILFGGGFALADGFVSSGLSQYLAGVFTPDQPHHPLLTIGAISFGITALSEVASNTATTQMVLPLLASASVAMGLHPLVLMIPATLAASMGFMLPIATPPNAIAFSTQRIKIGEMVRAGLVINILGWIFITLFSYFLLPLIFKVSSP